MRAADIEAHPALELIAVSDEAGVYVAKSTDSQNFFVFGHPEYDRETLKAEYDRDIAKGMSIAVPAHYFPDDDPTREPVSTWFSCAQLLYTNWAELLCVPRRPPTTSPVPARRNNRHAH